MSASTRFKIETIVTGLKGVEKLKSSIKQLSNTAKPTAADIATLRAAANRLGRQSDRTENELRQQVAVLTDLRANVSLTGKSYKVLTADIQKAEAALAKAGLTGKNTSKNFGNAARTLGAIAGAGVFGGPEGAIGAVIGGIQGGPGGALAGGAIGAQVGMLRRSIGGIAEYKAALDKQRLALRLVINDFDRYTKSQEFLLEKSRELAIPQDVIIRQFTQLTASVKGAGFEISDSERTFSAISAAIRGTGGTLEDMRSALLATTQVFSKGKVSAEELRQQLSERLPGSFTTFAESMSITPKQLDKLLEGGKVTLTDFMNFIDLLTEKYGESAAQLALAPETAGDRLEQAISELKDNLAGPLSDIGAMFQNMATTAVRALNDITLETKSYANRLTEETLRNMVDNAQFMIDTYEELKKTSDANKAGNFFERTFGKQISDEDYAAGLQIFTERLQKAQEALDKFLNKGKDGIKEVGDETEKLATISEQVFAGMKDGAKSYLASIKELSEEIASATQKVFKRMEDSLVEFITKGTFSFKEFASSIIEEMTRIFVRTQIMKPFTSWFEGLNFFGGGGTTNAKGNVYGSNGIVPFAKGGVVDKPTLFPFAKGGVGLMAEAGSPEAIMPLKRSQDGRLGVEAAMSRYSGSGSTTVNYTGPVMNFNGDDYVPRSAVTDIINAAANRGASIGEARTLSFLRNSRSRRSNLGL